MKKRLPLILAVLVVALVVSGCPTPGPVTPQPDADAAVTPDSDGGDAADPTPVPAPTSDASPADDDCARAEATLARLGCKDSRGQALAVTKGGKHFADVCRASAAAGVDVHPACLAAASTCKGASACSL